MGGRRADRAGGTGQDSRSKARSRLTMRSIRLEGSVFLLTGHIPTKGESILHPSGWRLEAVISDPRRIVTVRLYAPDPLAEAAPTGK